MTKFALPLCCLLYFIPSLSHAQAVRVLGRGWMNSNTKEVIAAQCTDDNCSQFNFVFWSSGGTPEKISEDFPLPYFSSHSSRSHYLRQLFMYLYQSEAHDEVDIVFNFKTDFGRVINASYDKKGWNWAEDPDEVSESRFNGLRDRIQGKQNFVFNPHQRCKHMKQMIEAVEEEHLKPENYPFLSKVNAEIAKDCTKQKLTPEDDLKEYNETLKHDSF